MNSLSLLVWSIIFAVIATIVASAKGLSLGKWAAIGFILGPIGVIWSLVTPKNEAAIAKRQVEAGEMKVCPFCAENIKVDAAICKYCGEEQPPIDPNLLEKWVCTHCKAICKGSQSICWVCNKPRSTA